MVFDFSSVSEKGLGVMSFTWRPQPISQEVAFEALNEAIKINLPKKTFINAGEFYGGDFINLKYLQAFFDKYPEQRQHAIISVKGAVDLNTLQPTSTKEGILTSIDRSLQYLTKFEIFEPARLDLSVSLEEIVSALDEAVDSGRIEGYTLSEVGASTLEKIYKLAKYKPLGVEVEYSLFTREIIENGVAAKAGELDVAIIAYSPLSRGFLTGEIKTKSDIPEGDVRHHFERFSEENIAKNFNVVEYLNNLAKQKGVTTAQLALAWVHYHTSKTIDGIKFPKVIPIPSSSSAARVKENFADIELSGDEFAEINKYIQGKAIYGHRYNQQMQKYLFV